MALTAHKSYQYDEDKIKTSNLNVAGYLVKEMAADYFMDMTKMIDNYQKIVVLSN